LWSGFVEMRVYGYGDVRGRGRGRDSVVD